MCQRLRQLCFAAVIAVWTLPSQSQDSRLSFERIVSEQVDMAMPVNAVAGIGLSLVMSNELKRTKFDPANIWVLVPADLEGRVDVNITTVDGRYIGKLRFAARPGPRRWERITLETDKKEKRDEVLRDYTRDHIAYTVSVKRSQKSSNQPDVDWLLVSNEKPEQSSGKSAAMLLNSLGAETVFYKLKNSSRRMCGRIQDRLSRQFDVACEIPLADLLLLADARSELRIERVSGMERLDPVVVSLR